MRATLLALNEELLRLKANGVDRVSVSDESIRLLRQLAAAKSGVGAGSGSTAPAPRPGFGERQSRTKTTDALPTDELPEPPMVKLPEGDKQQRWDTLLQLVQQDPVCLKSVRPGKKVVLGVGDLDAPIFFCGEAPGAEEENQGEPFVGPAGQLLTKMIAGMGLERGSVYLGNIMNWRPQIPTDDGREQVGNRPPTAAEMAYCMPYLRAQLDVVRPQVIVALGATAARGLLGQDRFKALGEIRGTWQEFEGAPVMATYHPSYILRNQTNRSKRAIWEDLLQVMTKVGMDISDRQRGYFLSK